MKKIMIPIIAALLVGTTFGIILFKNTKDDIDDVFQDKNILSIFQIGVFVNEDNANKMKNEYSGSIVIKDDIYYRVIYGAFYNNSCVDKMKNYLEDNKIDYHIRNIEVADSFVSELSKYEEIILQTVDPEVFLKTNEKILSLYERENKNAN